MSSGRIGPVPSEPNRMGPEGKQVGQHRRIEKVEKIKEISEIDDETKRRKFQRAMSEADQNEEEEGKVQTPTPFQPEFHTKSKLLGGPAESQKMSARDPTLDNVEETVLPSPSYSPPPPAQTQAKGKEASSEKQLPHSQEFWKEMDEPPQLSPHAEKKFQEVVGAFPKEKQIPQRPPILSKEKGGVSEKEEGPLSLKSPHSSQREKKWKEPTSPTQQKEAPLIRGEEKTPPREMKSLLPVVPEHRGKRDQLPEKPNSFSKSEGKEELHVPLARAKEAKGMREKTQSPSAPLPKSREKEGDPAPPPRWLEPKEFEEVEEKPYPSLTPHPRSKEKEERNVPTSRAMEPKEFGVMGDRGKKSSEALRRGAEKEEAYFEGKLEKKEEEKKVVSWREKEKKEKRAQEIEREIMPPIPPEAIPFAQTSLTQVSHYLNPQTFALFYQMVGHIYVLSSKRGISKTDIVLDSPSFGNSKFYGSTITIEKYATAPDSLNIRLTGTDAAVASFNQNLPSLLAAFQNGNFTFRIGRIEAGYKNERPLDRRKEGRGKRESDGDAMNETDR